MPGVVRDSGRDNTGGANIQGSRNTFVNSKPAVRVQDRVQGHGRGPHSNPTMVQGSSNVFVNGKKLCRAGDKANCGHSASGSNNVFANG